MRSLSRSSGVSHRYRLTLAEFGDRDLPAVTFDGPIEAGRTELLRSEVDPWRAGATKVVVDIWHAMSADEVALRELLDFVLGLETVVAVVIRAWSSED